MTQVWLVDREFDAKGLVRLRYATTDGTQVHTREIAEAQLFRRSITAARDVGDDELQPADDGDAERFAEEASRMAAEHDPDDEV